MDALGMDFSRRYTILTSRQKRVKTGRLTRQEPSPLILASSPRSRQSTVRLTSPIWVAVMY